MNIMNVCVGARGSERLVRDDVDRIILLAKLRASLGATVLAYCVMDTHLHVAVEGGARGVRHAIAVAIRAYARCFNGRHSTHGPLLRDGIDARAKTNAFELA